MLGSSIEAHAFLHTEISEETEQHSGVTDNLKTAIDKALRMNTSKEKYRELQKVFGSFGYYYPSVICLGGSSMVTGCEDWINSIQTNRMRIQFKSMKPLYELLDDERRVQIQTIYDDHSEYADSFLELTKGIHFDGEEAVEQAVELAKKGTFSKLIMLKVFTSHTNMERVKRPASDGVDIKKYSKLDLESHHELPGNYGFISGSKAAYSERIKNHTQLVTKTKNPYNVAYVTYKEIHYYDEFVQPTEKFKKAIANALQADIEDNERYRALQDVFQRFGYYYPSAIRYGGRIAYEIYPAIEEKREIEGGGYDSTQKTHAATNNELIQQKTYHPEHSNDLIKVSSDLFRKCTPSDVEKTLKKSDCWEAVGGESHLLFCDGVESWIKTVESNQTLIQLKNLKPIYELLDSETRLSIQHIYENIIIQDQYICYNYSLAMTEFSVSAEGQDQKATIHISTEPLFELLLQKSFPDSKDAIDFCRNECEGFGFSIVEEEYTDKSKKTTNSHCLWGIALLMISEAEWKFQKLASPDESNHNHYLTDSGKKSSQRPRKNRQRSPSSDNTSESLIIKLVAERPVYSPEDPNAHYVKYGDVVRIRYLRRSNDEESANENTYIRASDVELPDGSRLGQGSDAVLEESDAKDLDEDFRWTVMPCLSDSNESTSDEGNQKNLHENDSSHNEIREQPQLGTTDTDKTAKVKRAQNSFAGCVRKGDVIVFESQRVVGGKKFYWRAIPDLDLDSMNLWKSGATFTCEEAGWQLQAINEYEASKAADNLDRVEVKDQNDVARYRLSADASGSHEYKFLMGHAYLYGLKGLDIDASEALKYLTAASKDGDLMAKHELGKLLWSRGEYENILELLKEAACLPVIETYRELGDIYHTGFSSQDNRFVVSKDRTKAFMYYLTGGILGDWRAALTAGEYLEKGYLEDFGRDTKTALRWYEYVARQGENSLGYVAAGKLKHELAVALTNQSEAEDLREDAYKSFESATLSEPYARFMIAVYHLKGWGHQEHNPTLGFQMLLSLAESGISMVLKAIAECYQHGVGVDRDHEKASTYRELAARMDEHKNIAGKNDP
ncbi:hypothetical protein DFQ29_009600 [Apophysomyces sp. BC1021]|nr:hypothetical protein DFQ29_009600 [Apophysomyces sp. BC1021]